MTDVTEWEIMLRLALACALGGVIGYERQSRRKSAGLRTNMLVALGSCLVMLLSQELYYRVEGHTNADPARLAAQVVSGIGFLGAGAIMKEGLNVTGLTTAACLWVVAGVGLAVGAGYYKAALFSTVLVFVSLGTLSRLDEWLTHEQHLYISVRADSREDQVTQVSDCLDSLGLRLRDIKLQELNRRAREAPAILIEVEAYNRPGTKGIAIADALKKLPGVWQVEIN